MSTAQDLVDIYDGLNVLEARKLYGRMFKLALILNITVYDSLYLVAAKNLKTPYTRQIES